MNRLLAGTIAGGLGTTVINGVTNLDMAVRGRPASGVPERAVRPLAETVGLVHQEGASDDADGNRLTGLGALGGTLTGLGAAIVYAHLRPHVRRVPLPLAGLALGLGVMAFTDASATAAHATDPRTWDATSWLADLIPHAIYGLTTAAAVDLLAPLDGPGRRA
jgi:hypothetical protein